MATDDMNEIQPAVTRSAYNPSPPSTAARTVRKSLLDARRRCPPGLRHRDSETGCFDREIHRVERKYSSYIETNKLNFSFKNQTFHRTCTRSALLDIIRKYYTIFFFSRRKLHSLSLVSELAISVRCRQKDIHLTPLLCEFP